MEHPELLMMVDRMRRNEAVELASRERMRERTGVSVLFSSLARRVRSTTRRRQTVVREQEPTATNTPLEAA